MRYSQTSIDRVREADIVKTINNFVTLTRAGSNYKCKSPFTDEKTPSFVVSPTKQIFKCFSTSLAGDGIKFVQEHEKTTFIEAVEIIAKIHSIFLEKEEVTPALQQKIDRKAEMYNLTSQVTRSFVNSYRKLKTTHWAKQLLNERKFSEESIIDFQIGFSPNENALTKWSLEKATFSIAKELGLCDTKNNASYDKFKNRIIFPIHNHKGAVVGFGGRRSNETALSKYPKYINSSSSLIFDKSAVLYGLFQAKNSIVKKGTAILTEGYTDVIAMHQNHCENTIASSGTALTDKHAQLLKKYAQEVIILRDGDKAGFKATIRDIDILLSNGLNVSLCILPEDEDPDTFSRKQKDMPNWISTNKADAILWKLQQYDFKRKRYDDDVLEIKEASKIQIKALSAELKDIDSIKEKYSSDHRKSKLKINEAKEFNKELLNQIAEIKKETKQELSSLSPIDPNAKALAITDIAKTLFLIKHEVKRAEYVKQVAKTLKIATSALKSEISNFEIKATEERDKKDGKLTLKNVKLPEGANPKEYLEGHGFLQVGNTYHFQHASSQTFFKGTNFIFLPLFHIQGDKENKRLCEIIHENGQKVLVDFDSGLLGNFGEFKKYLFRLGAYMFLSHNGIRTEHFDKFVYRYLTKFEPALELLSLGWNSKGFYAFANGVYWNGKFQSVNKYGIMHLNGVDKSENDGYNKKIENYYSPAFSVMHKNNQEGDDLYENDRMFVYKESSIELKEWMQQLVLVFGEKGITGTLFNFGAIFRDLFLANTTSFPLLGGFGEKDSGKSAFGYILQNFFYYRLPPLDLTQVTHVGFSRRLSRNTNTVQFCDEYQDKNVREDVFNGLMGTWNGIGREKGKGVGTNRTSYDKVNSAVYYSGQFMPTKMENALATRTVSHFFQTKNYTTEEKNNFNKLLNWTNSGISSLVVEIMQHRAYFEQMLPTVHAEAERTLKDLLKEAQYQERIFGNVSVLLTTYMILKEKIDFPFNQLTVEKLCAKLIIDNSSQIADSNGLTEFWNIITFLFENNRITADFDFAIDKPLSFKIITGREKNKTIEKVIENQSRKKILFLRLKSVYQYYNKEASTREGVDVIGQTTIRQYFKSRKYFIGLVKGKRFGKAGSQSCYAFDYDMMQQTQLVTLEESNIPFETSSDNNKKPDDLPF